MSKFAKINDMELNSSDYRVETSARHVHLSQSDFVILFGKDAEMEPLKVNSNQIKLLRLLVLSVILKGLRCWGLGVNKHRWKFPLLIVIH